MWHCQLGHGFQAGTRLNKCAYPGIQAPHCCWGPSSSLTPTCSSQILRPEECMYAVGQVGLMGEQGQLHLSEPLPLCSAKELGSHTSASAFPKTKSSARALAGVLLRSGRPWGDGEGNASPPQLHRVLKAWAVFSTREPWVWKCEPRTRISWIWWLCCMIPRHCFAALPKGPF